MRVCEILQAPENWRGKTVAVVGRYSFRGSGRFLSEEGCESRPSAGQFVWPTGLQVKTDANGGPKLPEPFDIDAQAANRKLKLVRKTTPLGKFRFGSLDYDRWAIVYGRVEPAAAPEPGRAVSAPDKPATAPLTLVIHGDALIFFIASE